MALPNWHRRCVGCGQAKHKQDLLRIVKCKNNHLELDVYQKKPGRGAYICLEKQCALLAGKNHGLEKSFHIKVNPTFYEQLIKHLT